jgi:uncharacterized RmlC-like cupin family protein
MSSQRERGCVVVHAADRETGSTGLDYSAGISRESAGSHSLCLQLVRIPPGARARAHYHDGHETAAYVLEGEVVTWFGAQLEQYAITGPGDFVFIPAGVPHLPVNYGAVDAVAVIARTDPNTQESVAAVPELDVLEHLRTRPSPP